MDLTQIRIVSFRGKAVLAVTLIALAGQAVATAQENQHPSPGRHLQLKHGVDRVSRPIPYSTAPGPAGAHLTYYGGRVISNPRYVNVYWGPNVAKYGGDIDLFVGDLGTLEYNSLLSQYSTPASGTNQTIGQGSFQGAFTITPSPANSGSTVDDTAIQAELSAQITAGHLPVPTHDAAGNNNTIYNVFFPPGVTITQGGSSSCVAGGFCAYHGTVAASGSTGEYYYSVMPDMGTTSGCSSGCGGAPTTIQNLTSVLSHEVGEAITDAEVGLATALAPPLAWYDNTNGEIGDICNADQGTMVGPSGRTWTVQLLWSNSQGLCATPTQVSQTITFGALPSRAVGSPQFTVTASASSGLPINFTGGVVNVCSVTTGGLVTILGAGTCSITATQPGGVVGNTTYAPAPSVTQTFAVTSGGGTMSQTITFAALPNVTLGVAPFTVSATASSGLAVSFASLTASVCTVSGSTVTVVAAGTCSIQATQAGNATYSAATPVTQSFSVTSATSITNGGFETGNFSGWTPVGASETVVTGGHTGTYSARLGNTTPTNGDSSVSQTFTAPTGNNVLSFWYKMTCPDTVTYDWATAALKDNTAGTTATVLAKTCATTAWTQVTSPLTAGHSYTLTLTSHDDNYAADPSYTLYDDAVIGAGAPPPPAGITNGGFETGNLNGWTPAGASETAVTGGHTGAYAARLGNTTPTNGDSTITQTFTAPTGVTKLSLYYKMTCPDTVTYDWATVTLKDNSAGTTATVLPKTCATNASWVNLTGVVTAGHSYTLTLTSHDDNYGADPSYTLYDDVILQ